VRGVRRVVAPARVVVVASLARLGRRSVVPLQVDGRGEGPDHGLVPEPTNNNNNTTTTNNNNNNNNDDPPRSKACISGFPTSYYSH